MKTLRFIIMALAFGVLGVGLSSCVLNVENTAGNLESIMGRAKNVSTLRISGSLNGDDILYLRKILTSESCKVSALDLSDASIVDGGMAYIFSWNKRYTSKDEIGDYMFSGCRFRTVILPNTVTSIGYHAFEKCRSLKNIVIPNSVTEIGGSAFEGCRGLTDVVMGDGVRLIRWSAFCECTSLKNIVIPNSVTEIDDSAFEGCRGLTDVVMGHKVNRIGRSAFEKCTNLKEIIIPDGVTSIDDFAFEGCISLTDVVMGYYVSRIGKSAFQGCTSLKEITIPGGVEYSVYRFGADYHYGLTEISESAFQGCTSLYTLIIGRGVTDIGNHAFDECDRLYEFYCYATTPPNIDYNTFTKPNTFLYVPKGSLETYETAWRWRYTFTNISEME